MPTTPPLGPPPLVELPWHTPLVHTPLAHSVAPAQGKPLPRALPLGVAWHTSPTQ
jgi:hypothetical protein